MSEHSFCVFSFTLNISQSFVKSVPEIKKFANFAADFYA